MKDYSAAQIKKRYKCEIQQFPNEGSKSREIFDIFHKYKGMIIDFSNHADAPKAYYRIHHLRLFYGMDITHLGKNLWCFRGEYFGSKYVLYSERKPLRIKLKASNAEQQARD